MMATSYRYIVRRAGGRSGQAIIEGTRIGVWQHAVESRAIVVTCNRQDFLELAGTSPDTGLIVLNRRRTRVAEGQSLIDLLTRAGESGLNKNINFA